MEGVGEQELVGNGDGYAFGRYQLPGADVGVDGDRVGAEQGMAKLLFMVK